jgi:RHS repeat-associated protein
VTLQRRRSKPLTPTTRTGSGRLRRQRGLRGTGQCPARRRLTSYSCDQNGNELTAGTRTFTYDLANRLVSTTLATTTTTYTYDGDGSRLQASTGPLAVQKTNFLWDQDNSLPQIALERDGNNRLLRRYIYGQQRISMNSGSAAYYYHYDNLGSVANITSASGSKQWTETYEPFGTIRTETQNSASAPANFMKFTGEYADPTGLYHLRARQYDPATGRFLQLDPVDAEQTDPAVSSYGYVADRPTVMVDPSGMTLRPSSALLFHDYASSPAALTALLAQGPSPSNCAWTWVMTSSGIRLVCEGGKSKEPQNETPPPTV